MTKPIHVVVSLSPETIAALTEAMLGPPPPERAPPYSWTAPEPEPSLDVTEALRGRVETTIPEVLEAMGIPREAWTHRLTIRAGIALSEAGWAVARRMGTGGRMRVYRPLDKRPETT